MKVLFISVQIIALLLIFLDLFGVINYKYVSPICYVVLALGVMYSTYVHKKKKPIK